MKARKLPPAGPSAVGLPEAPLERYRTATETHHPCGPCGGTGFADDGRICGRCGGIGLLSGMGRESSYHRVRAAQAKHVGRDGVRKKLGGEG